MIKHLHKKANKVWGDEIWICNHNYCGKILNLKKGYQCSLHFHIIKDEVFYILSGLVSLEIDRKEYVLKRGDSVRILPKMIHRFRGLRDSKIIEFSTHHKDSDSYRIEKSRKS